MLILLPVFDLMLRTSSFWCHVDIEFSRDMLAFFSPSPPRYENSLCCFLPIISNCYLQFLIVDSVIIFYLLRKLKLRDINLVDQGQKTGS